MNPKPQYKRGQTAPLARQTWAKNSGWIAAKENTDAADDMLTGNLTDRQVASIKGLTPVQRARVSSNGPELLELVQKEGAAVHWEVANNHAANEFTVNYLARMTTSEATQLALLMHPKIGAEEVNVFADSDDAQVRTWARAHRLYKPKSARDWAGVRLNRLVHGVPTLS